MLEPSLATKMAQNVAAGLEKAQQALTGGASQTTKTQDLARNTLDGNSKHTMTTDFGVKVNNTDNWLKIANEDKTGPHILEDQIAREKVWQLCIPYQ